MKSMTSLDLAITDFMRFHPCDWIALPFKDRRRGSIWMCRWCRARQKGRKHPTCAVKSAANREEAPE